MVVRAKDVANLRRHAYGAMPPIDRDVLYLSETEISDLSANAYDICRPLFDVIWNAAGFPRSLNFDDQGNWVPP